MTSEEFRNEYQQTWSESPLDRKLRGLAEQYHELCEEFDRTVCLRRDEHGTAIPTDAYESATINRNASKIKEELARIAESIGATRKQFHEAIVAAARRRRRP